MTRQTRINPRKSWINETRKHNVACFRLPWQPTDLKWGIRQHAVIGYGLPNLFPASIAQANLARSPAPSFPASILQPHSSCSGSMRSSPRPPLGWVGIMGSPLDQVDSLVLNRALHWPAVLACTCHFLFFCPCLYPNPSKNQLKPFQTWNHTNANVSNLKIPKCYHKWWTIELEWWLRQWKSQYIKPCYEKEPWIS